jgi:rRNA maturation endonuclease Nob1
VQINLNKIIKPLNISEYDPKSPQALQVWVNPPVKLLQEYDELTKKRNEILLELFKLTVEEKKKNRNADAKPGEDVKDAPEAAPSLSEEEIKEKREKYKKDLDKLGEKFVLIYSNLWSQGAEETHCSVENIKEFIQDSKDHDPGFWGFLTDTTITMIIEHRNYIKKG